MRPLIKLFGGWLLAVALLSGAWLAKEQARAQNMLPLMGVGGSRGAAAPFVGPGDLFSWTVYYALRAYSVATKGGALINVCEPTNVTCVDFLSDATTGNLVFQTVGGHDCTADDCTVKIAYDLTAGAACAGTCDASQATAANRPTLKHNCLGSKPCMVGSGSQSLQSPVISSANTPQPNWSTGVVVRTGSFTTIQSFLGVHDGELCSFSNSADTALIYADNTFTATAADSSWHSIQCVFDGASSALYIDGANTTGNAGPTGSRNNFYLFTDFFGQTFTGNIGEVGHIISTNPNSTQKSNVNANQHSYWGF